MIINHNIAALNTHRQMGSAQSAQMNSMEKLSSGLRINSAKDDAAGLSISEKMRGQIRGLEQASTNAQDGISMIQTAEGALSETQDILQRMREVSTQAANGTLTDADRGAIQDEMNQLTSEMNRIGNTTEFNTQKLLQGDGKSNLQVTGLTNVSGKLTGGADATTVEATRTDALNANNFVANETLTYTINGEQLAITFAADASAPGGTTAAYTAGSADANRATIAIGGGTLAGTTLEGSVKDSLQAMIDANDTLKGNYTVTTGNAGEVVITAVTGGDFEGAKGNISAGRASAGGATQPSNVTVVDGQNIAADKAKKEINFSTLVGGNAADTDVNIKNLVETGMTINGKQVEFYNSNDGAYTGDAIGVNISTALAASTPALKVDELVKNIAQQISTKIEGIEVTQKGTTSGTTAQELVISSSKAGKAGDSIEVSDGGVQKAFKTSFQIGANTGQALTLEISDMRANALNITGKAGEPGFTATNGVTNGTDDIKSEASLNLMTKEDASTAIRTLDEAIASVSSERSKMGATQNRLEHTINNLNTSSENLTAAESRIRDVDYAEAA